MICYLGAKHFSPYRPSSCNVSTASTLSKQNCSRRTFKPTNGSSIEATSQPYPSFNQIPCRSPQTCQPTAAMLGGLQPRQFLTQLLNFALVLSTAFMLWKGLSVATDSPSPIVVVLSGSMEPAFQRGDLLFLWNRGDTQIGEIVVYNVKGKDIPIVHRVVRRFGGG